MSFQVLVSGDPTPDTFADVLRPSTDFSPDIWGDHFLSYATMEVDVELEQQVRALKEEVKRMLIDPVKMPPQQLEFIDDIQRLGVSYHFENEINEILKQVHHMYSCCTDEHLSTTALRFRLLRQQGYKVSSDVFNRFKEGNDQKFKASLLNDVSGLLSLYEATHLRIHGEDILEEALAFTTTHLESIKRSLSPSLSKQVSHSLSQPLWKGIPRVEARYYLSIYPERDSHNEILLMFAKLDFNLLQQLHQRELSEITRWWKDLDVKKNLPFTRDRITENYFLWTLTVYFEPQYSFARRKMCKISAMASIIDDIYDSYGRLDELEQFTEAIQRWDISVIDPLPKYMKTCYKVLLEIYTEIEEEFAKEGKLDRMIGIHYAKEATKKQAKYYNLEAKWVQQKYIPTMDEYIALAEQTTAYPKLITASFVGMGDIATKDSFEWVASYPAAVKGASVICRLLDDIADYKRGIVTSAVACYMKDYGVSEDEAKVALRRQVSDAWKDINESFFLGDAIPRTLLTRILNFARTMDVAFKNEDGYSTHQESVLKDFIVSTLVQPVPV